MTGVRTTYYPAASSPVDSGYDALVMTSTNERFNGTSRLLVCCHGHGGSGVTGAAIQYQPNALTMSRHVQELVSTGRYMAVATGDRGDAWGSSGVMSAIQNAVGYARNTLKCKAGTYALMGYSMGGLAVANWAADDMANIAAVLTWAGVLDGSYPWSANIAQWTTELQQVYGTLAQQRSGGYDPLYSVGRYSALRGPWKVIHDSDDQVVPYSVGQAFVSAAANPLVTLRTTTGGHTGMFPNVPVSEVLTHYDSGAW